MFTEHEHGPVPMTDMGIVPSDDNDDDGDYNGVSAGLGHMCPNP